MRLYKHDVICDALSKTTSLYSRRGLTKDVYIFSRASLLTLNLRDLNKFRLVHATAVMLLKYSVQLHLLLNVKPKCLYDIVFVKSVPFI